VLMHSKVVSVVLGGTVSLVLSDDDQICMNLPGRPSPIPGLICDPRCIRLHQRTY
jgi:hypothetical protein